MVTPAALKRLKRGVVLALVAGLVYLVTASWTLDLMELLDFGDQNITCDLTPKMTKYQKGTRRNWQLYHVANRRQNDTCNIFPKITIKHTEISRSETCEAEFCSTLEGNKRKIESYDFTKAEPYFQHLIPRRYRESIWNNLTSPNIELPVIVTGSSRNHYREAVVMIQNLKEHVFPVYKTDFIFFDLGLSMGQRIKIERICCCKVVDFPFSMFPKHVADLQAYCWKPIIMQLVLKKYNFVMWIDSSIRFQSFNLDPLFIKAKQNGLLSRYDSTGSFPLVAHIHEDTFLFLKEPPCLYQNFFDWQGGLIFIHSDVKLVYEYIFQTWVKCALVEECMKTKHDTGGAMLYCKSASVYHTCHRYDQALLGLFLYRLFPESFRDFHLDNKQYYYFVN